MCFDVFCVAFMFSFCVILCFLPIFVSFSCFRVYSSYMHFTEKSVADFHLSSERTIKEFNDCVKKYDGNVRRCAYRPVTDYDRVSDGIYDGI